jgi:23S rRNA (uracil1939-C5)-methyltransferase
MSPGSDGMPWRFRQKAAFVFGGSPAGLVMGHFARGTNDVVPIEECPVHAERANRVAFALRDALASAGVSAAGAGTDGLARHVVVRTTKDGKEAVAMLVATRDDPALREPLRQVLAGEDRPDGLVLNRHDRPGPYLVGRESKRIAGPGHVREESLGPAFLVSPTSFFQTTSRLPGRSFAWSWRRCRGRAACASSISTAAGGSSPCPSPCGVTRSPPSRRAARACGTPS